MYWLVEWVIIYGEVLITVSSVQVIRAELKICGFKK